MSTTGRLVGPVLVAVLAVLAALVTPDAAGAGDRAKEPAYRTTIELTVDDLQEYWADELPALYGVRYERIPDRRIIAYTSTSKLPRCGPEMLRYEDVAGNAFYCNAGRFVAYDDENLFPQLAAQFGDFAIVVTLAHEWGHVIQDQAGLTGPTIALEQQADCFAGAWIRSVGDGASSRLSLREGNLDVGLAGFLTFRDPPGSDPTADGAHGSAFDRVGAFQEGYDQGPERCAAFDRDPPELTDIPFAGRADFERGGDLPYDPVHRRRSRRLLVDRAERLPTGGTHLALRLEEDPTRLQRPGAAPSSGRQRHRVLPPDPDHRLRPASAAKPLRAIRRLRGGRRARDRMGRGHAT